MMIALPTEVVRDELISLLNESAEEAKKGEAQAELSLLLEAHFLFGELIQNQLNTIQCAPPLSPPADKFADERAEVLANVAWLIATAVPNYAGASACVKRTKNE